MKFMKNNIKIKETKIKEEVVVDEVVVASEAEVEEAAETREEETMMMTNIIKHQMKISTTSLSNKLNLVVIRRTRML
jgi:hypothetical protein